MKSPLRKLRSLAKPRRELHRPPALQDELANAAQDMLDMRNCNDSLLSVAATTTNSAFEFSEALQEMGTVFLQKTSLNDDDDSGKVLLMLGKTQFELQKIVDNYRAHIVQTLTTPSESLLKELHTVEEMKQQCDDKRDLYKHMLAAQREKGRSRNSKGETFSSPQLQSALEDYEEDATSFVFRLKSLKQGQSRSLMTQAARHHAAQLCFFRKGLKSLEMVEPHVKEVARQQHIDYQFSGLDDDATENDADNNYSFSYDGNDGSELSFDYGPNDQGQDAILTSRNSMEVDQGDCTPTQVSSMEPPQEVAVKREEDLISYRRPSSGSQSAPFFSDKFDPFEKIIDTQPSYVLPTPGDAKPSTSTSFSSSNSEGRLDSFPKQLWHSSPLQTYKFVKESRDDRFRSPIRSMTTQSVLKDSNKNSAPMRMPPPSNEELSLPQFNPNISEDRKFKRYAFSGPLTSYTSAKPTYTTVRRLPTFHSSVSSRVSRTASPPPMSSPIVNELHELPRPPISSARHTRPASLIGHSAPLISRGQEFSTASKMTTFATHTASPLPTPAAAMARSTSIPSSNRKMLVPAFEKLSGDPHNINMIEDVASPLTPIHLSNMQFVPIKLKRT